jgi:transposase-like protein
MKCPVCRSENIVLDSAGHTGKYRCKDCDYIGVLVIEED